MLGTSSWAHLAAECVKCLAWGWKVKSSRLKNNSKSGRCTSVTQLKLTYAPLRRPGITTYAYIHHVLEY